MLAEKTAKAKRRFSYQIAQCLSLSKCFIYKYHKSNARLTFYKDKKISGLYSGDNYCLLTTLFYHQANKLKLISSRGFF